MHQPFGDQLMTLLIIACIGRFCEDPFGAVEF
jgi:hypothetical protein